MIETGHTIVIGFDENIISILEELVMANKNVREVLQPAKIAGGERSEILNFQKTIAHLMIQSGRHPGMSEIFSELLSFRGNEIYVGTYSRRPFDR
ncbi:MAG TPA: hypothetical protein DCG37_07350 [Lachnospiraceae bacterium]|nr:hypothetical protein [Lachnospiraceae bacterium]